LADLFPEAQGTPGASLAVAGLASDSRKVGPGSVFVAVPGTKADGMSFAPQAIAAGAAAIVGEAEAPQGLALPYVRVADVRRSLALAAARVHPRQPEKVVAVTGTSGKSSVADFCRQIFASLGHLSASVGTLGVITSSGAAYGSLTTPDPISLHESFDRLAADGVTRLAMEASSHGIEQRRLDGVRLAAAGFTNLGRDHLDYHGTTEAYAKAKLRLFDTLLPEDAPADRQYGRAPTRTCSWGDPGARAEAPDHRPGRGGGAPRLRRDPGLRPASRGRSFWSPESKRFCLCSALSRSRTALLAAGLVLAVEREGRAEDTIRALSDLKGVPGRLERVGEVNGALCIVDYAHKPECTGECARGPATLHAWAPRLRLRLRRRSGQGQASPHGPHLGREGGRHHCHRRQSPLRGAGCDPGRGPRRRPRCP
jgi:UDP-N-acetylmuramoyl-L-alanyl-D-glutamate--2,6-diaminopimelate ligase